LEDVESQPRGGGAAGRLAGGRGRTAEPLVQPAHDSSPIRFAWVVNGLPFAAGFLPARFPHSEDMPATAREPRTGTALFPNSPAVAKKTLGASGVRVYYGHVTPVTQGASGAII